MTSKHQTIVIVTGILTIGGLEAIALISHVDGALFMLAVGAIGGLIGWQGKAVYNNRKSR